ncbi:G2 M-phase specific E3 ubiquitin protein ligase [Chamberlinius hualienensis]
MAFAMQSQSIDEQLAMKCIFCGLTKDDETLYGPVMNRRDVTVHYYCMLFSSGLAQNGRDSVGIMGFLLPDIKKEVNRSRRLKCSYCKKSGANIGCQVNECSKRFHYPCGIQHGSLHQFFGKYCSFCSAHKPVQTSCSTLHEKIKLCNICCAAFENDSQESIMYSKCCKNGKFHRACVQKHALSAGGYFFRCPMCNNREKFQMEMLTHGIYVPERDASWEMEDNAFQELYQRYSHCDYPKCICPAGRKFDDDRRWSIVLCDYCGSQGCHSSCGNIALYKPSWVCSRCDEIVNPSVKKRNSKSSSAEIEESNPDSRFPHTLQECRVVIERLPTILNDTFSPFINVMKISKCDADDEIDIMAIDSDTNEVEIMQQLKPPEVEKKVPEIINLSETHDVFDLQSYDTTQKKVNNIRRRKISRKRKRRKAKTGLIEAKKIESVDLDDMTCRDPESVVNKELIDKKEIDIIDLTETQDESSDNVSSVMEFLYEPNGIHCKAFYGCSAKGKQISSNDINEIIPTQHEDKCHSLTDNCYNLKLKLNGQNRDITTSRENSDTSNISLAKTFKECQIINFDLTPSTSKINAKLSRGSFKPNSSYCKSISEVSEKSFEKATPIFEIDETTHEDDKTEKGIEVPVVFQQVLNKRKRKKRKRKSKKKRNNYFGKLINTYDYSQEGKHCNSEKVVNETQRECNAEDNAHKISIKNIIDIVTEKCFDDTNINSKTNCVNEAPNSTLPKLDKLVISKFGKYYCATTITKSSSTDNSDTRKPISEQVKNNKNLKRRIKEKLSSHKKRKMYVDYPTLGHYFEKLNVK